MSLNFEVIPAIDLMDGCVVRLLRGDPKHKTVYSRDPLAVARQWDEAGARWLHVVDLDGAFTGQYRNFDVAQRIIAAVPRMRVEISGGIRTMQAVEQAQAAGAARIILGTKACEEPEFVARVVQQYGKDLEVAVALDARRTAAGTLEATTAGWVQGSGQDIVSVAKAMRTRGVELFVVTDISRDGTLSGPNLDGIRAVLRETRARVIASGGVSSLADLEQLNALVPDGLVGAIVGKALYEDKIDLTQVFARAG